MENFTTVEISEEISTAKFLPNFPHLKIFKIFKFLKFDEKAFPRRNSSYDEFHRNSR